MGRRSLVYVVETAHLHRENRSFGVATSGGRRKEKGQGAVIWPSSFRDVWHFTRYESRVSFLGKVLQFTTLLDSRNLMKICRLRHMGPRLSNRLYIVALDLDIECC